MLIVPAMDYSLEQTTELELIQSVYPDELEVINSEYPHIQLNVKLPSEPVYETSEPLFYVTLALTLPERYPEEPPSFSLDGFPTDFSSTAIEELRTKLEEQASSMPGFQVLITLITELQYSIPLMLKKVRKDRDDEDERRRAAQEEAELKKFEKNRVTVASFNEWRVQFEQEFLAAERAAKKAQEASLAGRLTGKQLFLRDSSLINSDLSMLENAEDESVDIDQSLFADDLDDLDIDDEDSDEDPDYNPDESVSVK